MEDYFSDDKGQPLSKQSLKMKNAMTQLATRNMPVQYSTESEPWYDAFHREMSDIAEKDRLNELYKKPTDFNPDDVTVQEQVTALGNMSNITVAYLQKKDALEEADINEKLMTYEGKEFSMENALYASKNPHFYNYLKDNPVDSWDGYLRQEAYFNKLERDKRIVSETVSPWISIPASIIMGIVDVDTVVLGATTGGLGLFGKGAKLLDTGAEIYRNASTAGKIGIGTGLGVTYSGINESLYQKATGEYSTEDMKSALVFGGLFGGGLGALSSAHKLMSSSPRDNTKFREDLNTLEGKVVDKQTAYDDALGHYTNYKETLDLAKSVKANTDVLDDIKTETVKNLHKKEIDDLTATKPKVDDIKNEFIEKNKSVLTKAKETVKTIMDNANTKFKVLEKTRTTLTNTESKLNKEVESVQSKITAKEEAIAVKTSEGKKTEGLSKQLNSLKKQLDTVKKEVVKLNTQKKKLEKQSNITKPEEMLTKSELNKLNKNNETITKFNDELDTTVKTRKETYDTKLKELRSLTKEQLLDKYKEDPRLVGLESKYKGKTKEEIVQDLLQKTDNYKQWASKLEDGTFTVNDYIMADATKKDFVNSLAKDLLDLQKKLDDSREFAKILENEVGINHFMKRILITPISRLQTSDNPAVRALAYKMATGTIYLNTYVGKTALRQKQNLDEVANNVSIGILEDFKAAKANDSFKGTRDEYFELVGATKRELNEDLKTRAWDITDPSLPYNKRVEDFHTKIDTMTYDYDKFEISPILKKSVERLNQYFDDMHTIGKTLGIDGFNVAKKGYLPRKPDIDKINAMGRDNVVELLVKAQVDFLARRGISVNINSGAFATIKKKAEEYVDGSLTREANTTRVIDEISEHKLGNREITHARQIEVDERDIADILKTDSNYLVNNYGRQVNGNFALKDVMGVYKKSEFEQFMKQHKFNSKEYNDFMLAIDDIKGIREIVRDPDSIGQLTLGMLNRGMNLAYVGNFGMTSLGELFVAANRYGYYNTMKNIIPSAKSTFNLWKNSKVDDKNYLISLSTKSSITSSKNAMSVENAMAFDPSNNIAFKLLDKGADTMSKIGLLPQITDFLRHLSTSSAQSWLAKKAHDNYLGKSLSKADKIRLSKMNILEEELPLVRKEFDLDETGLIRNDNQENSAIGRRMVDGMLDSVDATIMSGKAMHIPTFMSDRGSNAWINTILFKFMRYPIEAYEKLLLRGIQEADARTIVSVGFNTMLFMLMYQVRDAMKPEEKKKRYDGEDGFSKLVMDGIKMNSFIGAVPSLADFAYGTLTGKNLFDDKKAGSVTASFINNIQSGRFGVNVLNGRIEYDAAKNQLQIFRFIKDFNEFSKE